MFVGITNATRDYAWGSDGAISSLLGLEPTGRPEAELWLGTHPGSPSTVVGSQQPLAEVAGVRLPFLLKVLAAGSPLSLQAHPTPEQARAGFERENAQGIAVDAANRNYRDASHKPELIYALEDGFEALCGFREPSTIVRELEGLAADIPVSERGPIEQWIGLLRSAEPLRNAFEWLVGRGAGVEPLVATITALADGSRPALATVRLLADHYPGDAGIVASLMLNHVVLAAGEVLYLPAGNIHAYVSGIGIELMAASDNVLRGGLTPKHVDVVELLSVLDFRPLPVPYLAAEVVSASVTEFRPPVPDFVLTRVEGAGVIDIDGPAIVLCVSGVLEVSGFDSTMLLERGGALFASGDERPLAFSGGGTAFIATTGRPH